MEIRSALSIFLTCLLLTACAPAIYTQKVETNIEPIRDLSIAIWMGSIGTHQIYASEKYQYRNQFKAALENRFPKVFEANGIPVKSTIVMDGEIVAKPTSSMLLSNIKTSHVLILNPKSVSFEARAGVKTSAAIVHFDADLWDVNKRTIVWKARPYLILLDNKPLYGANSMAAQLLNGMNKDGINKLKTESAIDLFGKPISGKLIFENDDK